MPFRSIRNDSRRVYHHCPVTPGGEDLVFKRAGRRKIKARGPKTAIARLRNRASELVAAAARRAVGSALQLRHRGSVHFLDIVRSNGGGISIVIDFDPATPHMAPGLRRHPDHVFSLLRGPGCLRCRSWFKVKIQLCRCTELGLRIVD